MTCQFFLECRTTTIVSLREQYEENERLLGCQHEILQFSTNASPQEVHGQMAVIEKTAKGVPLIARMSQLVCIEV